MERSLCKVGHTIGMACIRQRGMLNLEALSGCTRRPAIVEAELSFCRVRTSSSFPTYASPAESSSPSESSSGPPHFCINASASSSCTSSTTIWWSCSTSMSCSSPTTLQGPASAILRSCKPAEDSDIDLGLQEVAALRNLLDRPCLA
ncbi:hypothetical protein M758_UG323200 [Ceratodon purpureus]|nr:hypothetical protein M758_UG323200 [Ceratodon purpureus]